MRSPLSLAVLAVPVAIAAACGGGLGDNRGRDMTPTSHLLGHPIPDGTAETNLAIASPESSSGSGGGPARGTLLWNIAHGTREFRYNVASCEQSRVVEGEGGAIATAYCDDVRYDVVVDGDRLELRRDGESRTIFTLPANFRVHLSASGR